MEKKELEFFRQMLNEQLNSILVRNEETRESMSEDAETYAETVDRATAESSRAFALRLLERDRKIVHKINQALKKIDDGSFGICEECGDEIAFARLQARPMTTLCIECKKAEEEKERLYNGD